MQEFNHFREEIIKHMDEEETFLFPKMMRNEPCYRHQEMGPEIHKGSVNLYLKLENHRPKNEFKRMITFGSGNESPFSIGRQARPRVI